MAIGGVHVPVVMGAAALSCVIGILAFIDKGDTRRHSPLPRLFWGLLIAAVWMMLQSVPLGGIVSVVSADMDAIWADAGIDGRRLSANVHGTRLLALKAFSAAVLLAGAFVFFLRRSVRVERVGDLVVGATTLAMVVAFVQDWFGADKVLFFYTPQMGPIRDGLQGPFVNPDHFGAFMAIGALVAFARALTLGFRRIRYLYYVLSIFLLAALLLSVSLSAVLGWAVGVTVITIVWRLKGRYASVVLAQVVPLFGLAAGVALVAIGAGLIGNPVSGLIVQFEDLPRLFEIWRESVGLIIEYPLSGTGSGALSDLLASRLSAPAVSVTHARSQLLQLPIDIGLPVALLVVGCAAWDARRMFRNWPSEVLSTVVPLMAGLSALAMVALFDFALEIGAIGIIGILFWAALSAEVARGRKRRKHSESSRLRRHVPLLGFALASFGVAVSGVALYSTDKAWERASAELAIAIDEAQSSPAPPDELADAGRELLSIRPASGRTMAAVGEGFLLAGDPEHALEWLQLAASHVPTDAHTLHLLGTAYLRLERWDDAAQLLSEAISVNPDQRASVVETLVNESFQSQVWQLVCTDRETEQALVQELVDLERTTEVLRYASLLLAEDSTSSRGLEVAGRGAMAAGSSELAGHFARALLTFEPNSVTAHLILAEIERTAGQLVAAEERIEGILHGHEENPYIWHALAEVLLAQAENSSMPNDFENRIERVRDHMRPHALSEGILEAEFHHLSARYYFLNEQWRAAVTAARNGLAVAPNEAALHEILGLALFATEDLEGAERALANAVSLDATRTGAFRVLLEIRGEDPDAILPIVEPNDDPSDQADGDQPLNELETEPAGPHETLVEEEEEASE